MQLISGYPFTSTKGGCNLYRCMIRDTVEQSCHYEERSDVIIC